ncbi:hypothetical protein EXIGLDRAFT_717641, partial [Exidia glandulosa HHB12029]
MRADEDALRAAVSKMALSVGTPLDLYDAFELTRTKIHALVTETLQSVAADLNRTNPLFRLPPEILCYIASYLPLTGRVRAALVCRRWRSTILSASSLWTRLTISLAIRAPIWNAALDVLFARSAGQPLSLVLQIWYDEGWGDNEDTQSAVRRVAHIVRSNMFRLRSLSLQIPAADEMHDYWACVLTTPAPMLERFFLHCTDNPSGVPTTLLGDHAPALTNLCIDYIPLPTPMPRVFQALTILHCDCFDDWTLPAIASLKHLKKLTISSWRPLSSPTVCPQSIDLFLVGSEPTCVERTVIQACFPHVKSIRYSLYHAYEDDALDILSRALNTADEVTSLFVRWSKTLGTVPWEGTLPGRGTVALAIEVNSTLLAVDVMPQWFLTYLDSPAVLERFTSHLETATVTEEVWLLLMFVGAPRLKEASILLDEHKDYGESPLFSSKLRSAGAIRGKPALTTLRLSCQQRPPVQRHRTIAISAVLLARQIQCICAGRRKLSILILRDIVIDGTKELENLVEVIRHEDSIYCADTEALESWT